MNAQWERRALIRALTLHVEGLRALHVTSLPGSPLIPQPTNQAGSSSSGRGTPDDATAQRLVPFQRDEPHQTGERARTVPAQPHGRPSAETVGTALAELARSVVACRRCPLYRTRTHAVISDGNPHAELVFVGEAPGREEDLQGRPFVGAAGQLLTKMIAAISMKREEVYICNVLKDRPPGNRTPLPEEIEACRAFLEEQLAIVHPRVICTLGAVATKALLGSHVGISAVRGQVRDYRGIPLVPTFHPAYLLRNPAAKRLAWADLKRVKSLLETAGC